MQFQYTYQQAMDGSKTETSRLRKSEDTTWLHEGKILYVKRNGRILWEVGKTYAEPEIVGDCAGDLIDEYPAEI
jgi:hypothetical protein